MRAPAQYASGVGAVRQCLLVESGEESSGNLGHWVAACIPQSLVRYGSAAVVVTGQKDYCPGPIVDVAQTPLARVAETQVVVAAAAAAAAVERFAEVESLFAGTVGTGSEN